MADNSGKLTVQANQGDKKKAHADARATTKYNPGRFSPAHPGNDHLLPH
jgi:hypothetical protein